MASTPTEGTATAGATRSGLSPRTPARRRQGWEYCDDLGPECRRAETGSGLRAGRGKRTRRPWTPGLAFLAHRLEVSELYVELMEAAAEDAIELLSFEAEPLCWRRYAAPHGGFEYLKPDAFVRVGDGDYERGAFVEIDRGTEAPATIMRKATAYRRAWEAGREQARWGYFPLVVFAVPDDRRKEAIAQVCARQPAEAHPLFRVVLADELLATLVRGTS